MTSHADPPLNVDYIRDRARQKSILFSFFAFYFIRSRRDNRLILSRRLSSSAVAEPINCYEPTDHAGFNVGGPDGEHVLAALSKITFIREILCSISII